MFCRRRNIREIDMAIVIRIAVVLLTAALTLHRLPSAEGRASSRMLQPQPLSSTAISAAAADESPSQFIESNSIARSSDASGARSGSDSRLLKRVFLSNRTITCNDGSQAGFYLRKSVVKSKRWVVFLEGGWHCFDTESCKARWTKYRNLMTSAKWPETREDVGGILSPVAEENPYWHDANHIFLPYCSSDSWSGTRVNAASDRWAFMGALIVRQVMADLIPLGLGRSQGGELMLAGSSAGGLGVMLNLDRVKKFLREERSIKISVRGVSDSGWFLDRAPFAPGALSAADMVKQGHTLWQGMLPEACVAEHEAEPWRCYFGHRIYDTLKAPLFVFQWLFDEAQMRADHVGTPVTKKQWDFIHETGIALRASLDNVTAVFAPSCVGHAVLTRRDWLTIRIDDYSLPEAIRCWERNTNLGNKDLERRASDDKSMKHKRKQEREQRRRDKERRRQRQQRQQERRERQMRKHQLAKERQQRQQRQKELKRRNGGAKKTRSNQQQKGTAAATDSMARAARSSMADEKRNSTTALTDGAKKRKNGRLTEQQRTERRLQRQQERQQRQMSVPEPTRCNIRLLERCSWPQCNQSCPNLTNPLTGKEMRFLELLSSFGLDIEAVATALGVDMTTLSNMDRGELLSMLTQTS